MRNNATTAKSTEDVTSPKLVHLDELLAILHAKYNQTRITRRFLSSHTDILAYADYFDRNYYYRDASIIRLMASKKSKSKATWSLLDRILEKNDEFSAETLNTRIERGEAVPKIIDSVADLMKQLIEKELKRIRKKRK